MLSTDHTDPILRVDKVDPMLSTDNVDAMESVLKNERTESALRQPNKLHMERTLRELLRLYRDLVRRTVGGIVGAGFGVAARVVMCTLRETNPSEDILVPFLNTCIYIF